ncbi:MAG: NAD(P)-dependent oxidoreductase [Patescibacteria group bacterium]|mgnify:CR=1 FL=1
MKKKVLVTGACGFVGSHLVDMLIEKDYEVIATDLAAASKDFLNSKAIFIPADFSRAEDVKRLFKAKETEGLKTVFHIGAIFDFSPPESVMYENNVVGTYHICRYFAEHPPGKDKLLILYSSGAIYGDTSSAVSAEEGFKPDPRHAYERTKFEQEKVLMTFIKARYFQMFKSIIIRPAAIIGPRSRYGAAKIIQMIAAGQLQFFLGKKNLRVAAVHVKDVAAATIYLAEFDWQKLALTSCSFIPVFNVVDDSRYTYEDLISYVASLLKDSHNAKILSFHLPIGMIRPLVWWQEYLAKKFQTRPLLNQALLDFFKAEMAMNNHLLKSIGFTFQYSDTKAAIADTIHWYLKEEWI